MVLLAAPALADERTSLGFFGVKANGITDVEKTAIADLLQSELVALGRYRVIAQNDLAVLLGLDRQKQLLGCADEGSSCLGEVMGALDVDRLLVGDVSRIGDKLIVNLTLLDARGSTSISRGMRQVSADDIDALLEQLRPLLYEVVNADGVNKSSPLEEERGFGGLMLGARADGEVLGLGLAPSITLELSGKRLGAALVVLVKYLPGARLEGRFYPFTLGRVRTQIAAGVTAFTEGVAVRGAVGVTVHFGRLQVFADAGYERFLWLRDWQELNPNAVTVGLGLGWLF